MRQILLRPGTVRSAQLLSPLSSARKGRSEDHTALTNPRPSPPGGRGSTVQVDRPYQSDDHSVRDKSNWRHIPSREVHSTGSDQAGAQTLASSSDVERLRSNVVRPTWSRCAEPMAICCDRGPGTSQKLRVRRQQERKAAIRCTHSQHPQQSAHRRTEGRLRRGMSSEPEDMQPAGDATARSPVTRGRGRAMAH